MNPYRTEEKPRELPKMPTKDQALAILITRIISLILLAFIFIGLIAGINKYAAILSAVPFLWGAYILVVDYIQRYE